MKKKLFNAVIITAILLILGSLFLWDRRVKFISSYLSYSLDMPISIGGFQVKRRGFLIQDIKIYNPKGSPLPTAFEADEIYIGMSPKEIFKSHITVKNITVKNTLIGIDVSSQESNWEQLLKKKEPTTTGKASYSIDELRFEKVRAKIIKNNSGNIEDLDVAESLVYKDIEAKDFIAFRDLVASLLAKVVEDAAKKGRIDYFLRNILTNPLQFSSPLQSLPFLNNPFAPLP